MTETRRIDSLRTRDRVLITKMWPGRPEQKTVYVVRSILFYVPTGMVRRHARLLLRSEHDPRDRMSFSILGHLKIEVP